MKKRVNMIWMANELRSAPPFRILIDLLRQVCFEFQSVRVPLIDLIHFDET